VLKPVVSSLRLIWLLVALAGSTGQAMAQAGPAKAAAPASLAEAGGPAWRALTARQRKDLAPLERDWPALDAARKAKWLEVSSRFGAMPADEQQRVQARMSEWARLTPAERGQARRSFQEKKALTSEQKQQRWEAYQGLPDDHRQALAAKARAGDDRKRNTTSASVAAAASAAALPGDPQAKRSATPAVASSRPNARPLSPVVVQAKPGATTTLINNQAVPPAHQLPGQPRIAAKPGQVDNKTLLPKSGPQAAASGVSAPARP
jgi:hypothetical protein